MDAPYECMPLFVRAGSIIPFGPEIEFSSEKQADPITLYVYAGKDGTFTLYEDEGTNYNYEKGKYTLIPIYYNDSDKTLVIRKRTGEFTGMLKKRKFNIIYVHHQSPKALDFDLSGKVVEYNGSMITIELE